MSEHDDRVAAVGAPQRFARQGTPGVTYTPVSGSGDVTLTAVFGVLRDEDGNPVDRGVLEGTGWSVTIARDPADADYGGIAEPVQDDTLTLDGVTWSVEGRDAQTPTTTTLRLSRVGRSEASRSAFAPT